jgi:hypothetical protein
MSAHSEKAQRTQYFEGNHEAYGFRLHEMDPSYVDLQYQPAALSWTSLDKKSHQVVFDYAVEMADGQIIFGEDKASQAFFTESKTRARLELAEGFLDRYGVKLERRVAGGLPSSIARRVVKDHFDARKTLFVEQEVSLVQHVIRANGGAAPLSSVLGALEDCPSLGLQKLSAMMMRRKVPAMIASRCWNRCQQEMTPKIMNREASIDQRPGDCIRLNLESGSRLASAP